jgi:hypothetical protein
MMGDDALFFIDDAQPYYTSLINVTADSKLVLKLFLGAIETWPNFFNLYAFHDAHHHFIAAFFVADFMNKPDQFLFSSAS